MRVDRHVHVDRVSILYLRCDVCREECRGAADERFNSLFEMHTRPRSRTSRRGSCFNSLFEMPVIIVRDEDVERLESFNSLFEMRRGGRR